MARILTEVDSFDASITVPEGGDARTAASVTPSLQSLANRSKNVDKRVTAKEQVAFYQISATAIATDGSAALTLTEIVNSGGFSLAANLVQVPSAGTYQVLYQASGVLSADVASVDDTVSLDLAFSGGSALLRGFATNPANQGLGHRWNFRCVGMIVVATPSTQKIGLGIKRSAGAGTFETVSGADGTFQTNNLSIIRLL